MNKKQQALMFIFLLGLVSLFSDLAHEGARSILGPYLGLLGASAATIGFVTGLGEFIGYAFRLVSGYISDKTKSYWLMMMVGYGLNLLAIPLLAFVPENGWIYACGLILIERFGKAIRNPAKNTLVSFASYEVGVGKGFALQEALDQIGAFLGPVILFIILTVRAGSNEKQAYELCFLVLGIVAIIALLIIFIARHYYPHPDLFDQSEVVVEPLKFNSNFWWYLLAIGFVALGFADFPLMAYHLNQQQLLTSNFIPLIYALAMAVDAVSALFFGQLYDRHGLTALVGAIGIAAWFAPLVFLSDSLVVVCSGIILWGIGMGAQESILKAAVASLVPKNRRATAYGFFNAGFGTFWFLGSWLMGVLYSVSLPLLVCFSAIMQLLALPVLIKIRTKLIANKTVVG
jgi:MFS family permease